MSQSTSARSVVDRPVHPGAVTGRAPNAIAIPVSLRAAGGYSTTRRSQTGQPRVPMCGNALAAISERGRVDVEAVRRTVAVLAWSGPPLAAQLGDDAPLGRAQVGVVVVEEAPQAGRGRGAQDPAQVAGRDRVAVVGQAADVDPRHNALRIAG